MCFIEAIFLVSIILILQTYFLYPISINILSFLFERKYRLTGKYPDISIIISAYNEARVIKSTINNFLSLDYPKDRWEIIIGSDGSTDSTNEILEKLEQEHSNLKIIVFPTRRGKKEVINDLVKTAKGEILIFSDSNTLFKHNSLVNLVKFFSDERVGGVCGKLELISSESNFDKRNKEVLYWDYETWIKNAEGRLGALIGANGGIYGIRKSLFVEMPHKVPVVDDLFISLKILEQGRDFIYTKDAVAREYVAPSLQDEFDRKVRIIPRSFETIKMVSRLLFGKRLIVSYGLWSHKIIRWFSPIIFIIMFLSNVFIINYSFFYLTTFLLIILFLIFVLAGYVLSNRNIYIKLLQICFYFFIGNLALLKGIYNYFSKKHQPIWQPTPRK